MKTFVTVTARALAPILALALLADTARAETLSERAAHIEARLAEGDGAAAVAEARRLYLDAAGRAGFGVQGVVLTTELASGYGVFTERAEAVYAPGEPIYGYVEPFGYSLRSNAAGLNEMVFDVEFALMSPSGEPLTDITAMGEIEITSYNQPIDAYFHLTYRITGPAGPYVIWTRVTDRPTGRQAEFSIPVEFRDTSGALSK